MSFVKKKFYVTVSNKLRLNIKAIEQDINYAHAQKPLNIQYEVWMKRKYS